MEYHLKLKRNLRDQKVSQVVCSQSAHQAYHSTKLGERFRLERNETSSADFHPEKVRNFDNVPQKPQAFHQRQRARSKADELVRYMSSLPGYLEREENLKEKSLNVGVLEWCHLEKWQYNHQQTPDQSCKSSPSNGDASSFFSTERSSTNSGRGHSCSPANQRIRHPAPVPNLNASPTKVYSIGIKSFKKNGGKFQDLGATSSNYLKVSQSILSTHQCFNKYKESKGKECKSTDSDPLGISDEEELRELEKHGAVSNLRERMRFDASVHLKEKKNLQVTSNPSSVHDSIDRQQPVVLHQPKNILDIRSAATSEQSNWTRKQHQGSIKAGRHSFSDKSNSDVCEPASDTFYSYPLPHEVNTFRDPQIQQPSSIADHGIGFSSDILPNSGNISSILSRGRILEGKKLRRTLDSSAVVATLNMETEEDRKVRNPSPIRRLMGRIGRSSSSKDNACVPKSNIETDGFRSRGVETSVSLVESSCDKSNVSGKGRSSPLRRLIDPLLKPRAGNCDHSFHASQRESSPIHRMCKVSKGRGESAQHSVKVRLDLKSCKTIDIDHPQEVEKRGSSTTHAFLQVAVKSGLPLFTFAVDSSGDILAATMRKLNPGEKDGKSWIYTFFTVHEMSKKYDSWLNKGNRSGTHGYVPNIVAQMKVSDVLSTELIRQKSVDQRTIREFVLVAVNQRQGDQHMSGMQANDELAAIVLNPPLNEGEVKKLSMVNLEEPSYDVCSFSESRDVEEMGCSARSVDLSGLAVILPGGEHGIPSKGEPSPLIERWRSGGSCDCGGWDLGCRTRVLSSQFSRTSGSAKSQPSKEKFHLYSQEQGLDRKPIFSLSLFKDDIYSVEFDSSLKLPQAFSICIAFLDGLQPANFYEFGYFSGIKSSGESASSESDGPKVSNTGQKEYSASNVSYPPVSPVKRL